MTDNPHQTTSHVMDSSGSKQQSVCFTKETSIADIKGWRYLIKTGILLADDFVATLSQETLQKIHNLRCVWLMEIKKPQKGLFIAAGASGRLLHSEEYCGEYQLLPYTPTEAEVLGRVIDLLDPNKINSLEFRKRVRAITFFFDLERTEATFLRLPSKEEMDTFEERFVKMATRKTKSQKLSDINAERNYRRLSRLLFANLEYDLIKPGDEHDPEDVSGLDGWLLKKINQEVKSEWEKQKISPHLLFLEKLGLVDKKMSRKRMSKGVTKKTPKTPKSKLSSSSSSSKIISDVKTLGRGKVKKQVKKTTKSSLKSFAQPQQEDVILSEAITTTPDITSVGVLDMGVNVMNTIDTNTAHQDSVACGVVLNKRKKNHPKKMPHLLINNLEHYEMLNKTNGGSIFDIPSNHESNSGPMLKTRKFKTAEQGWIDFVEKHQSQFQQLSRSPMLTNEERKPGHKKSDLDQNPLLSSLPHATEGLLTHELKHLQQEKIQTTKLVPLPANTLPSQIAQRDITEKPYCTTSFSDTIKCKESKRCADKTRFDKISKKKIKDRESSKQEEILDDSDDTGASEDESVDESSGEEEKDGDNLADVSVLTSSEDDNERDFEEADEKSDLEEGSLPLDSCVL